MKRRPYFIEVAGDGQLVKDDSGEKGTIGRRGARPDSLEATAQQHRPQIVEKGAEEYRQFVITLIDRI